MTFLLSEQRLKTDFLNDNVDSALVLSAIQTAQDIYLRQTLGDSLFETICELVENNSVVEPYKTLLDDYIIVYLEYLAMSELCVTSTFKLGNIGVAQAYDNNVNTQSIQNVKYLESFYKQKASTYENRLVTYIQQNINYFPEYLATNTVTTAKESTLQTGLFLGGTKTKTTNRTTSNKNTLVGAVRYDKQQNLSEQEKEQARENIGVSANGDIDINLDNYYTKDEVNELIDNVDVDLSEYYTKDEVYNKNQVDTKLVPYITDNEVNLRLDSYYDKQEVDEKIANVSSGGTIDLSNYYTKDETYSKEEVNDLIANSGGGGSDTPSNMLIVDIMSLNYDEQLELIDFVIDNNRFPDLNTLYTYQGYILNNLTIYSDLWNEENGERYVVFSLYAHPKSYDIRFITYQWNEGKIYNDITEKDFNDWLVTNGEINDKLNTLSNGLVLDLFQYDNDELAHVYNKIYYMGEQFTDKPITYRGKFINNITIEGENVRFWHYAITTDSNNINSDKSFYVDVEMYDDIMGLVRTTYTEIGDCTVIGGNGGGTTDLTNYYNKQQVDTLIAEIPTFSGNYNDLSNKPSVDIMSLPYSEQYEVLQYLVDNNVLPYTVTYKGVVLNNLPVEIDWWDEEQNQRQIIFSVYGVQSYNIRFITYQWNEGKIYNDTHAKEETENLVKKGEVDERFNNLNIPTLPTLATVATSGDYNDLENKPTLFSGSYNDLSDKPTIPTATSQLTLDTVYSKSEIDLQFESVNTTLGDINNLLEQI